MRLPLPNTPYAGDVFQSTHLHEVRLLASVLFDTTTPSFNPRTYTRCDGPSAFIGRHSSIVSIHAPTRGATYSTASFWLPIVVFQSTHLHEVRLCVYLHKITIMEVSIHAPTRGATYKDGVLEKVTGGFNPRTYTRCDFNAYAINSLHNSFNPRTYTRCDALYLLTQI